MTKAGMANRLPLGHCVMGTWEGLTVRGTGCFADPSHDLVAALEFRPQKLAQGEECWFVLPATVGRTPVKIVGQVRFARDFKQREGFVGAALAVPEAVCAAQGYTGAIGEVTKLFATFEHFCIGANGDIAFNNAGEALTRFASASSAPAQVAGQEPVRLRLPQDYDSFICPPELCRVVPPEFVDAGLRGFILRGGATPEFDHDITPEFLSTWATRQFGITEQRAFESYLAKTHQAYTDEKRKADELTSKTQVLIADASRIKADLGQQLDGQMRQLAQTRAQLQTVSQEKARAQETLERNESDFTKRYKALAERAEKSQEASKVHAEKAAIAQNELDQARADLARVRDDLTKREGQQRSLEARAKKAEDDLEELRSSAQGQIDEHKKETERKLRAETAQKLDRLRADAAVAQRECDTLRDTVSQAEAKVWQREETIKQLQRRVRQLEGPTPTIRPPRYEWPRKNSMFDRARAIAASALLVVAGGAATAGAVKFGVVSLGSQMVAGGSGSDPGIDRVKKEVAQMKVKWNELNRSDDPGHQNHLIDVINGALTRIDGQLSSLTPVGCLRTQEQEKLVKENESLATYKINLEEKNKTLGDELANLRSVQTAGQPKPLVCPTVVAKLPIEVPAQGEAKAPPAEKPVGTTSSASLPDVAAAVAQPAPNKVAEVTPAPPAAPKPEPAATSGATNTPAFPIPANDAVRAKAQELLGGCKADDYPSSDKDFIGYGESLVYCLNISAPNRSGRDACRQYDIGKYFGRLKDFRSCRMLVATCPEEVKALPATPRQLPTRLSPEIVMPFTNLLNCIIKTRPQ